jgi:hypothetical protein
MSLSNKKHAQQKKRHNLALKNNFPLEKRFERIQEQEADLDLENLYTTEIIYQNELGEYYALQDYEE